MAFSRAMVCSRLSSRVAQLGGKMPPPVSLETQALPERLRALKAAPDARLGGHQSADRVKEPTARRNISCPATLEWTSGLHVAARVQWQSPEHRMKNPTLETLFNDTLRDIYYAERKILKTLPKMMRAAQSGELRAAFEKHRDETEIQVQRLQQVFELCGKRAQAKTCPAIDGIMEEGDEIMDMFKGSPAVDAGLVAAAQAVEHYEMARYGSLCAWADTLGMTEAAALLRQSLQEETATDEALMTLAQSSVNASAMQQAA